MAVIVPVPVGVTTTLIVAVPPTAIAPRAHEAVDPENVQLPCDEFAETMVIAAPVNTVATDVPVAAALPVVLLTVTDSVTFPPPRVTGSGASVIPTARSGRSAGLTVVVVEAVLFDVLGSGVTADAVEVAVMVPVACGVTAMVIVAVVPAARAPTAQVTVDPEMVHVPCVEVAEPSVLAAPLNDVVTDVPVACRLPEFVT